MITYSQKSCVSIIEQTMTLDFWFSFIAFCDYKFKISVSVSTPLQRYGFLSLKKFITNFIYLMQLLLLIIFFSFQKHKKLFGVILVVVLLQSIFIKCMHRLSYRANVRIQNERCFILKTFATLLRSLIGRHSSEMLRLHLNLI